MKLDIILIKDIFYNLAFLLTLTIIYTVFQNKVNKGPLVYNILLGISIGTVGIIIMTASIQLGDGIILDARSILISVTGLFFGALPTLLAGVMIILYRIFIGGAGIYPAVLVIIAAGAIGSIWHRYRFEKMLSAKNVMNFEFYFFGLLINIIMLLSMFVLPKVQALDVLESIFLPIIILYPIGTYLICVLLKNQYIRNNMILELKDSKERLSNIIEGTNAGTWEWNVQTGEQTINERWADIVGYTLEELSPVSIETWKKLCEPKDLEASNVILKQVFEKKIDFYKIEFRMKHKNGKWVYISSKGRVNSWTPEGKPLVISGTHTDVSERVEIQSELKKSEERFRIMFEEAPLGIGLFDLYSGKATQINKKFSEILGYSPEEMDGMNWIAITHPDDMAENEQYREQLFSGEINGFNMKKRYFKKDGSLIWINLAITLLDPLDEVTPRELCMIEDITEKVKRDEEMLYLSCHDVLTGLYNRMFFEAEKKRLDTERQLPLSVIIGDVDGLKLINDGFGYASGDNLLIKAGNILKKCCRAEEIVSRIGGDEFCILLPNTTSNEAGEIIQRIHDLSEETSIEMGSSSVKVSISVGHDTKTSMDEDLSGIIINAENSMRRRKLLERKSVRSDLMSSIKATMLEKSNETVEHAERLVKLSKAIGEKLKLSDDNIFELELATTLHDIGKMSIDQQILMKPGKLTEEEWGEIKKHPEAGYRIAQSTSELMSISEYILSHHERWDGKGYPQGLKAEEIPLIARIINVVDSYDAMTSKRTYGKELSKEEAIIEMRNCSGSQFDPELLKIFLEEVLTES